MNIGREILRPVVRPLLQGLRFTRRGGMSPTVLAYQLATGISSANARIVDKMLSEARACGIEPAFMWVGGALNQANQAATVIGGTGVLTGPGSTAPVAEGNGCRFQRGRFFEFDNPAAVKGAAVSELVMLLWVTPQSNDESHRVFSTYTPTSKGFDVTLAAPTRALSVGTYPTATGTVNNIVPFGSSFSGLQGTRLIVLSLKPSAASSFVLDAQHADPWTSTTIYNNSAKLYLGGLGTGYTIGQPYAFSNAIIHAAILAPAITAGIATKYRAGNIPFTAGFLPAIETSAVTYMGDSTTSGKWPAQLANGTTNFGGQWAGKTANHDLAVGGTAMDYHIGKTAEIVASLSTRAYGQRYFYYCPEMLEPSIAATLGIPATFEAWTARCMQWLDDIYAQTGATMVIGGYIKGNVATYDATARTYVDHYKAQTLARGWKWISFEDEPHSQVWTGAVPGTYGFYSDSIHQTTAGCQVQAEWFAASFAHPYNTAAPRFNVAAPPTITGTPSVGQVLTCSVGTPHVAGTSYTYQWLANLTAIGGATASTYTVQAGDAGKRLSCRVTAVKSGQNSASFAAAPTAAVA